MSVETISLRNTSVFRNTQQKVDSIIKSCLSDAGKIIKNYALTHHSYTRRSGNLDKSISIMEDMKRRAVRVFINERTAPYAKYVIYGTKAHPITPSNKKALNFNVDAFFHNRNKITGRFEKGGRWESVGIFAKNVEHPGSKSDNFLVEAIEATEDDIVDLFVDNLKRKVRNVY